MSDKGSYSTELDSNIESTIITTLIEVPLTIRSTVVTTTVANIDTITKLTTAQNCKMATSTDENLYEMYWNSCFESGKTVDKQINNQRPTVSNCQQQTVSNFQHPTLSNFQQFPKVNRNMCSTKAFQTQFNPLVNEIEPNSKPKTHFTTLNYQKQHLTHENKKYFDKSFFFKRLFDFDGSEGNLIKFLSICDFYYSRLGENDLPEFMSILSSKLTGRAYNTMRFYSEDNYEDYRSELVRQFKPTKSVPELYTELTHIRQKYDEDIQGFVNRFNQVLSDLNDAGAEEEVLNSSAISTEYLEPMVKRNEKLAKDIFTYAVKKSISDVLVPCRFKTLQEATTFAIQQDRMRSRFATSNRYTNPFHPQYNQSEKKSTNSKSSNHPTTRFHHAKNKMFTKNEDSDQDKKQIQCEHCKKIGHLTEKCWSRLNKSRPTADRPVSAKK